MGPIKTFYRVNHPREAGYNECIMRTEWVARRTGDRIRTQMHYARLGTITEEMQYVAGREKVAARNRFGTRWPAAG